MYTLETVKESEVQQSDCNLDPSNFTHQFLGAK